MGDSANRPYSEYDMRGETFPPLIRGGGVDKGVD